MEKSNIKWYSKEKGYGFIETDSEDVFFNINDVINKTVLETNVDDAEVEFETMETQRGIKAKNVTIK